MSTTDRAARPLDGALIAFDLDGTLVDTAPDLIGSLNVVLGERRLASVPVSAARTLVGHGARALIERGFAQAGEPLSAEEASVLLTRFIDVYRDRIAQESLAFEGVEAALDALADQGARLAVCTNKPTDLSVLLLKALKLDHRFAAIVGGDTAPAPKPDARHLLHTIEKAGGDPKRAIMVGDSKTDFDAARAAAVPVILVPFGYTETPVSELNPDAYVERFVDLPEATARLLARLA